MDLAVEFGELDVGKVVARVGDMQRLMCWAAYFQLRDPDVYKEMKIAEMFEAYQRAKADG